MRNIYKFLRRSIHEFCGDTEKKLCSFEGKKIYHSLDNVKFIIICIHNNYYKNYENNNSNNITKSRDKHEAVLRLARLCGWY